MTTSYKASTETVGRLISRTVRNCVRTSICLGALVLTACSSPTAPPPPVTPQCTNSIGSIELRVLIVGHLTNRPISGVPAQLDGFTCTQTSGADGIVRWRVQPGQRVTVIIRGTTAFRPNTEVLYDSQWLISFPE